jgi:hypothetical protein
MSRMVSATSSCSRSRTAVAPMRYKLVYSSSISSSFSFYRRAWGMRSTALRKLLYYF